MIYHIDFIDYGADVLVGVLYSVCVKTNYSFGPIDSNVIRLSTDKGCAIKLMLLIALIKIYLVNVCH